MGTAYDYAVRFGIAARGWAKSGEFIAHRGAQVGREQMQAFKNALHQVHGWPCFGVPSSEQAAGCLRLAMLDVYHRAPSHAEMEEPTQEECEDLIQLMAMVPWEELRPRHTCILNPDFGPASTMIGGADADLIVDHRLIDMKVLGEPNLLADHYRQVVCYALMANRYGASGRAVSIDEVCVLQGRTGEIVGWPLSESIDRHHEDLVLAKILNAERWPDSPRPLPTPTPLLQEVTFSEFDTGWVGPGHALEQLQAVRLRIRSGATAQATIDVLDPVLGSYTDLVRNTQVVGYLEFLQADVCVRVRLEIFSISNRTA